MNIVEKGHTYSTTLFSRKAAATYSMTMWTDLQLVGQNFSRQPTLI